jgi:hypothetical protein
MIFLGVVLAESLGAVKYTTQQQVGNNCPHPPVIIANPHLAPWCTRSDYTTIVHAAAYVRPGRNSAARHHVLHLP